MFERLELACRFSSDSGEWHMSGALEQMRKTLKLAFPMVIGNLATQLMYVVDMAMVGRVGVAELAAGTFATNVFNIFWFVGLGIVTAISVSVGEAHGAGDDQKARHVVRNGFFVAGFASAVLGGGLAAIVYWTDLWHLGQPEEVIVLGRDYLLLLAASSVPLMLFIVQKAYCESRERPWEPLWFNLGAIALNVVLNWILIYGNLGAPALGLVGAGIATLLSRIIVLIASTLWIRMRSGMSLRWSRQEWMAFDWVQAKDLTFLGIPIGLQIFFEIAAFNCAGFMMGWLPNGVVAIAAHSIALNYAGLAFMVPLGVMFAAVIRVGQARGAGRLEEARTIGWTTIALAAVFMAGMAAIYALGRNWLPRLYLDDSVGTRAPEVLALASILMLFAAALAIADGVQVTAIGVLRGYRDTRIPTLLAFVGYWLGCLPLGFWMGFRLDGSEALPGPINALLPYFPEGLGWGAPGIWAGICISMIPVAVAMFFRFRYTSRGAIEPSRSS
jgi:MATE family multidrug resistance protein|tara:strand:+ start:5036 stop:6535 length:1500 start_codon:yes stop_codon:yes gene_type:complete